MEQGMELCLEAVATVSIKRKKPWPRFSWLGDDEAGYGLYMMDSHRVSQLSLKSGKTKRKLKPLAGVQSQIALTCCSASGSVMAGLTCQGDLFLWHQDSQVLETYISPLSKLTKEKGKADLNHFQGHKLFVSDSGEQALLLSSAADLYLWELDNSHHSLWWKLFPPEGISLAMPSFREAIMEACFHVQPVMGDCCNCVFVHTSRSSQRTVVTNLLIRWKDALRELFSRLDLTSEQLTTDEAIAGVENADAVDGNVAASSRNQQLDSSILKDQTNLPVENCVKELRLHSNATHSTSYQVPAFIAEWKSTSHSLCTAPPLTSRGCYVGKLSPTASVLALVINARQACDTKLLFCSPSIEAGLSQAVYGESDRKSGRTYWIADMAWSADGLLVVCVTRRGSLMIAPRFGRPVKLLARGCSLGVEFCYCLPLHPLITVIAPTRNISNHETSESSERDALRQRFSVCTHPLLPFLLCSDGYSLTVLSYSQHFSVSRLVQDLVATSRSQLGLPPLPHDFARLSSGDNEDFLKKDEMLNELALNETGVDFDSTLASTFTGAGLLMSLDAGAIRFAGVDSDLEGTQASLFSHSLQQKRNTEQSIAQLLTAWGLILTCSPLEPGNGCLPRSEPFTPSEVKNLRSQFQSLGSAVVDSIASLSHPQLQLRSVVDGREAFLTVLDLVPFDSLMQSSLQLVASLVNAVVMVPLRECLEIHEKFQSSKQRKKKLQSMREFVGDVFHSVVSISELLYHTLSVIDFTYGKPSSSTLPAVHPPLSELHIKPCLAPLLSFLPDVLRLFWNDLKSCAVAAETILASSTQSSRFHNREIGLLFENLVSSLRQAIGAIQSAMVLKEQLLPTVAIAAHGNTITSEPSDQAFSALVCKLEKYELRGSLEMAHSYLKPSVPQQDLSQSLRLSALTNSDSFLDSPQSAIFEVTSDKEGLLVIGCLARLMAAFFTNQQLLIPTSSKAVSTPAQSAATVEPNTTRCIELDRCRLSAAVGERSLSECWTVDHAVELLLLCDLWEEACQFVSRLGDWKKAVLLASAYVQHSRSVSGDSTPRSELLEKLSCRLVEEGVTSLLGVKSGTAQFELHSKEVKRAISNTLYVCALTKLDSVLVNTVTTVISQLTSSCRRLPLEVPCHVYLPAPPLFCPQPTPSTEDVSACGEELALRGRISSLIATLVCTLEAANCLQPCVRHYCAQLQRLFSSSEREVLGLPHADGSVHATGLPLSLLKRIEGHTAFGEMEKSSASVGQLLGVFRQLCGLLWLLHCRDQASLYLHKTKPSVLLKTQDIGNLTQAAIWTSRLLPFSEFLCQTGSADIEHMALSSLSELPSSRFLADLLAWSFPNASSSHTPRLEAKLKRLLARLRSGSEDGTQSEPLSVRYQLNSHRMLEALSSTAVTKFHPDSLSSSLPLPECGGFMFEYDIEYAQFLDTVFAVLCPEQSAESTVSQSHAGLLKRANVQNTGTVPYLSEFIGSGASDETFLPFLSTLSQWSQNSDPQVRNSSSESPAMRVNISTLFVANCLKKGAEKSQLIGHTPPPEEPTTHLPPHAKGAHSDATQLEGGDRSLHLTDLEATTPRTKTDLELQSSSDRDIANGVSTALQGQTSLLCVPEGVLQGQLAGQSVLDVTVLRQSSRSDKAQESAHKPRIIHPKDVDAATLEMELTESFSTGEFPSGITLSYGEFRSQQEGIPQPNSVEALQSTAELRHDTPRIKVEVEIPKQNSHEADTWDDFTTSPDQPEQNGAQTESYSRAGVRKESSSECDEGGSEEHSETDGTITPSSVTLTEDTPLSILHAANSSIADLSMQDTLTELSSREQTVQEDITHSGTIPMDGPQPIEDTLLTPELSVVESPHSKPSRGSPTNTDEADGGSTPSAVVDEPSPRPPSTADGATANAAAIGEIVRAEMKKILELQQQQHVTSLLAVVGHQPLPAPAVEGELVSQQQDLLVEEERNGGSQLPLVSDAPVSLVSPVKSEATNAAMSSSSSTAPVLNVEDLQSSSDGLEHPTHITIDISAATAAARPLPDAGSRRQQESAPIEPQLSSGSRAEQPGPPADVYTSQPPTQRAMSQVQQPSSSANVPLLHFNPTNTVAELKMNSRTLDQHYPGLSRNLKVFGDSITGTRTEDGSVPKSNTPFPLLQLSQNAEATPEQGAGEMVKASVASSQPASGRATVQLLQIPKTGHSHPTSAGPVLLKLPDQATATYQPHAFPHQKRPLHPPSPSHQLVLPQVPLTTFTPMLVPPNHLKPASLARVAPLDSGTSKHAAHPLLKLDDPLTKMKREGFKLLQIPPDDVPRLLGVLPSVQTQTHVEDVEHGRLETHSPQLLAHAATQTLASTSLTSISDDQCVSGRESEVMVAPLQSSKHFKPNAKKKKKRRIKQVTWKRRSPDSAQVITHPPAHSDHPQSEQPNMEHKQPFVLKYSSEPTTFPDYAPLDVLELRRLDINSPLPSSNSDHSEAIQKLSASIRLVEDSRPPHEIPVLSPPHSPPLVTAEMVGDGTTPCDASENESRQLKDELSQCTTTSEGPTAVAVPATSLTPQQFISVVDITELQDDSNVVPLPAVSSPPCSSIDSTQNKEIVDLTTSDISHISETGSVLDSLPVSRPLPEPALRAADADALSEALAVPYQSTQVLERLQLLEEQLNAIESTARAVEGEFKESNQILHTIDHLQTVSEYPPPPPLLHSHPTTPRPPPPPPPHSGSPPSSTADVAYPSHTTQPSHSTDTPHLMAVQWPNDSVISAVSGDDNHAHRDKCLSVDTESFGADDAPRESTIVELVPAKSQIDGALVSRGAEESESEIVHPSSRFSGSTKSKGQVKFAPVQQKKALPVKRLDASAHRSVKSKEKRDREKRHLEQRIHDAFALMSDMLNSKPETANTQTSTTSHPPNVHRLSKQVANATKPLSSSSSAAGLPRPSAARGGVAKLPPKGTSKLSMRKSPRGGRSGSHKELFDGNVRKSGSFVSRGRHLSETYTKESAYGRSTGGSTNNNNNSLKATTPRSTMSLSSTSPWTAANSGKLRRISSVEGLTEDEQEKMAHILASTEFDRLSVSSGSIASTIDWDEVDKILEK